MATIISFSGGRATRSAHPEPGRATAEIVIFPGVRYERATHSGCNASGAADGPKRDHLSIPD
ncbi:MAG: hypothetical protein KJZ80_06070 [Hyphomicrobiaceae bacterium]|nr:hypothetical protein [Hyphomicrobiaceae bacterium]